MENPNATAASSAGGRTVVIGVGMQKGGVAKTTNAAHLAVALGEVGRRVLLWDVDENHGATKLFRIPPDAFAGFTTMDVLSGTTPVADAILAWDDDELDIELPENVDFIPCSRALTALHTALSSTDQFFNPNDVLSPYIAQLRALGRYDYILIDTGPHASATTRSAYIVADHFILSVVPEKLAIDSLPDALNDIANARKPGRNPNLHLLGLILSRMDRRRTLAKRYEEAIAKMKGLQQANGDPVKFKATIGTASAIDTAAHLGKTLLQTDPNHRVSEQFRELAREVEERIRQHAAEVNHRPTVAPPAVILPEPTQEVVTNG